MKNIKVKRVIVSQLIDLLLEMEGEGIEHVDLLCKITETQDTVSVVSAGKEPSPPPPPGLGKMTNNLIEKLINAA